MASLIDFLSQRPGLALTVVFAAALLESVAVIGTVIPGSSIVFAADVLTGLGFARAQAYLVKHGGKSVFLARFLGPVRAIVPVVAGMSDMPVLRFTEVSA